MCACLKLIELSTFVNILFVLEATSMMYYVNDGLYGSFYNDLKPQPIAANVVN